MNWFTAAQFGGFVLVLGMGYLVGKVIELIIKDWAKSRNAQGGEE